MKLLLEGSVFIPFLQKFKLSIEKSYSTTLFNCFCGSEKRSLLWEYGLAIVTSVCRWSNGKIVTFSVTAGTYL
jgi:hypothetical protein